jgi:hypothetical protein
VKRAPRSVSLDSAKRNGEGAKKERAPSALSQWRPGQSGNPGGLTRVERVARARAREALHRLRPQAVQALRLGLAKSVKEKDTREMRAYSVAILEACDTLDERASKRDDAIDVTPRRIDESALRELLSRALELQRLAEPAREEADATSQDAAPAAGTAGDSARLSAHEVPGTTQAKELSDAELDALASLP